METQIDLKEFEKKKINWICDEKIFGNDKIIFINYGI